MNYRLMRFPGWRSKAVTFSYDDGLIHDRRLLEILNRRGIKCTLNLNSKRLIGGNDFTVEDAVAAIAAGHEIAVHGAEHLAPGMVPVAAAVRDALICREELETALHTIIRGMAYPDSGIQKYVNGSCYADTREILKAIGIVYARTLGGDNSSFNLPEDWYAWLPTAHHGNDRLFEFIDAFLSLDPDKGWPSVGDPRLFYLWGHSYEFQDAHNWERLEAICEKLGGREDLWYATNIDIHDYIEAYRSLFISADGRRIYNPTATVLYFCEKEKNCKIEPGETLTVDLV